MSGALYSIRLGNGLARCCANKNAVDFAAGTTTSEYGAPGSGSGGTGRTLAIRPPLPAQVMHGNRDEQFPLMSHSRAVLAAAVTDGRTKTPPEAAGCKSTLPSYAASHHISADGRLETRSTTTGEDFQRATHREVACLARKPAADVSRFRHYCTADDWTSVKSIASKVPPSVSGRSTRRRYVVTENAGCCPITGASGGKERDGGLPALTTNSATYDGGSAGREGATAAQTCRKHSSHLSNITHGDPRKVNECCSTNRDSYKHPIQLAMPPGHAYSRAAAVSAFLRSSVHFGADPSLSPSSSGSQSVPRREEEGREGRGKERTHRNASFLPQGDLAADRVKQRLSHSTTRSTHTPPPAGSYPAHVDSSKLHTASSIFLGHTHSGLAPPSATMATSYQPRLATTHRVRAPAKDNIPFDYYPGHLLNSTAASSYRAHHGDLRHSLPPATLRNLKISHW